MAPDCAPWVTLLNVTPTSQPRLNVTTLSFASMQLAATSPVTHLCATPFASMVLGSGWGQEASTLNPGTSRAGGDGLAALAPSGFHMPTTAARDSTTAPV